MLQPVLHQELHHDALGIVSVLVLVDQNEAIALPVGGPHLGELQRLDRKGDLIPGVDHTSHGALLLKYTEGTDVISEGVAPLRIVDIPALQVLPELLRRGQLVLQATTQIQNRLHGTAVLAAQVHEIDGAEVDAGQAVPEQEPALGIREERWRWGSPIMPPHSAITELPKP